MSICQAYLVSKRENVTLNHMHFWMTYMTIDISCLFHWIICFSSAHSCCRRGKGQGDADKALKRLFMPAVIFAIHAD